MKVKFCISKRPHRQGRLHPPRIHRLHRNKCPRSRLPLQPNNPRPSNPQLHHLHSAGPEFCWVSRRHPLPHHPESFYPLQLLPEMVFS